MLLIYYIIILIMLIAFIGLLIFMFLTLLYILPMAKGAVYVPSKPEAIKAMIKLAKVKSGMKVADLGSGDGRVVAALAKTGASVDGYEINPLLVWRARRNIAQAKLQKRAKIIAHSYWDADLSIYDVIVVYGITYIMKDLSRKLRAELQPGAVVASNYFKLPNWKKTTTLNGVHLYRQTD
jgi:protein-L-isoaspartate O-methyltransferase